MRLAAKYSQEEFGRLMHYSASMVSAVELGQRPLDLPFLTRADTVLDTGGLFVALWELARRDREPVWFRPWLDAERSAAQLRCFEPTLVPGLLQTEAYARAVLRTDGALTNGKVEQLAANRLERQAILTRDDPPEFFAVLDERALRRTGEGYDALMAEQLAHLVECAEQPHISIHVIPSDVVFHIGQSGPFALARSPEGGWVGHLETQLGGFLVDSEEGLAALLSRWDGVRNEALSRRQSLDLIKEMMKQWT
ncbi:helix-turn-helix domain-containing protein [Micromonospora sp. NPDC003197]